MSYKIAIVVHGRFFAFDLAKALLRRGHHVRLFTNYPRWAVARFGFPVGRVSSRWGHGVSSRVFNAARNKFRTPVPERWLHESFGRWAARTVAREQWDAVFCFSGVAEELLETLAGSETSRWLVRGSCHIRTQARLLAEEERRVGWPIEKPSEWMIAREEREYGLADVILTLSTFARKSFRQQNVVSIPLGVDVQRFRAEPDKLEERQQRIRSGKKLRVLFVGTQSFQKGLLDLAAIARQLSGRFDFRLVGPTEPQASGFLKELKSAMESLPAVPEARLPEIYAWGDVFLFPTIQDGFAVVLAQANASGLPILTTTNCGGSDFLRIGETGWILPIRSPDAFIEKLNWCDQHRSELAAMVGRMHHEFKPRTWDDVAVDYESALDQIVPDPTIARQRVHA